MNLLKKKEVSIATYRIMADKSVRVSLDLGELTKEEISELHGLVNEGLVSVIITTTEALNEVSNGEEN